MPSESTTRIQRYAAMCDNCGLVADNQIDMDFPHGASCGECGGDLDTVRAVDEPTEVSG